MEKVYKGPNRRENLIDRRRNIYDRRTNKWFGWYVNWLFNRPFRLILLVIASTLAILFSFTLFANSYLDLCDCDGDKAIFERKIEILEQK
jgi:hypothetical protein